MNDQTAEHNLNELGPTLEPLVDGSGGNAIRAALDRVREMRFRFVQLSATMPGLRPRDLGGSARRDLLATLRRRELNVSGLDAWILPRHFLDPATADRALGAVQQAIELAADLGRVAISMNVAHSDDEQSAANAREVVGAIGAHADRFGVPIADHSVPPATYAANLAIGIDPAAWLGHGRDPAAAILQYAPRVIAIRLCDLLDSGMRSPAGNHHDGRLDLLQYRIAVSVAHFTGPIVIDARQWNDPWSGIQQSRAAWLSARVVG